MKQITRPLDVQTARGLTDVTRQVQGIVEASGIRDGLCTVFIRHTSASLIIQENADPAVQRDLEAFLSDLAPDGDPRHTHNDEGDDDMPSHVKSALTRTSEQIPVVAGRLALGTWQGLYVWDHRRGSRRRQLLVHVLGE
jgi:secondary thiamine-phosphate synthase enzyme